MPAILGAAQNAFSAIMAVIMIPLYILTGGIDTLTHRGAAEAARTNIVGAGAYFRSQGITTDGEYFYFSGRTTLIKTKGDYRTVVNENLSAIPDEAKQKYNSAHIGGLSYYNGKIYCGLEDSKVFEHPVIGMFDCDTLELEQCWELTARGDDGELEVQKGVPWVCVDPESGLLYLANHNKKPTKLLVYDVNNGMEKAGEIELAGLVYSIQGAEFYGGELYAATNDDTQAIYKISLDDGTAGKVLDRNLSGGGEGEGMTFAVKDGKPVIAAIDMGPLFINAYVREYNIEL